MTCQQFLAGYSEYLDDRMSAEESARWRGHAESCARCARYDHVVRTGLERVREVPRVEPSPDFRARLQRRLRGAADDWPDQRASGSSAAVSVAIAAVLAAVAWSPLIRSQAPTPSAPATASAPARSEHAGGAGIGGAAREPGYRGRADVPAFSRSRVSRAARPLDAHRFLGAGSSDLFSSGSAGWYASSADGWYPAPGPHSPVVVTPPAFRSADAAGESAGLHFAR